MNERTEGLLEALQVVAREGATRAGRGLSGLVGQEILIHIPQVRQGTRMDACNAVGGDEAVVLGGYLSIAGDISGHLMLVFPERTALQCADLMCGRDAGSTGQPDELTESAIAELANIVGSAFVNALADHARLTLHPSPPAVVHDMAVALIQSVYAEVLAGGGDVLMIDTVFEDSRGDLAGLLIVAPDPETLTRLEAVAA